MDKTYLKDASIVSVYDIKDFEKTYLVDVLCGTVIADETFRFRPFEQVVTSKIVKKAIIENKLEITTYSNNCYVIDSEHKSFDISFAEFMVMRSGSYSPERILEIREQLKPHNIQH